MKPPVGFGILGANSFVANAAVLPAIEAAPNATLVAAASRGGAVPARWSDADVDDYEAVLRHPGVDAVYIPLPNGLHREWTEKAASAGKHVLCEKPLAPTADDARAMAAACASAEILLAEAWMTPFDRRWRRATRAARTGEFGDVVRQHLRFTFTIGPDAQDNYRWDPLHGGGALLDVGIYTVGTAVEVWGIDCDVTEVARVMTPRGVDAATSARLDWPDGRTATIRCSFVDDEAQRAEFASATERMVLADAAFTSGGPDADRIRFVSADPDTPERSIRVAPGDPYLGMVEAFSDAVAGLREWPRPVERSIELLELLEHISRTEAAPHA
jgi:predicted dehydrogenase